VVPFAQLLAETAEQRRVGAHDEDLMVNFRFEVAQGHSMLLEEAKQMLAGDAAILRARNSISAQAARVEPLAHGAGRDLAYLRDLPGRNHFFHGGDSPRLFLVRALGGFLFPPVCPMPAR